MFHVIQVVSHALEMVKLVHLAEVVMIFRMEDAYKKVSLVMHLVRLALLLQVEVELFVQAAMMVCILTVILVNLVPRHAKHVLINLINA